MGDDLKSRRTVFAGVGAGGLALALTACGAGGDTTAAAPTQSAPAADAPAAAGGGLASTADIPVGGGKIFADQKIVVTQPTEGDFKAFSATCTHKGCAVTAVENGVIDCACHGSKFKIEDGSVSQGPATEPLAAQEIKVEGDQITLA
ncbi:Rieske (2Fe-2S) protein [Nonomuraea glycinis]|jgi:Rieske Fe-S protein|uniref:Rieske (2Fe-2S) protein n=1 Tax=Nonomuraea glycinis TaxID=2047744 RepID=UPI002E0DA209|nr:Rieske (2Fe-2S) protein [Nonomuraea glycinis]